MKRGDFYEDDEPLEDIERAWAEGEPAVTVRPLMHLPTGATVSGYAIQDAWLVTAINGQETRTQLHVGGCDIDLSGVTIPPGGTVRVEYTLALAGPYVAMHYVEDQP